MHVKQKEVDKSWWTHHILMYSKWEPRKSRQSFSIFTTVILKHTCLTILPTSKDPSSFELFLSPISHGYQFSQERHRSETILQGAREEGEWAVKATINLREKICTSSLRTAKWIVWSLSKVYGSDFVVMISDMVVTQIFTMSLMNSLLPC